MKTAFRLNRFMILAFSFALMGTLGACDDDPVEPEEEPEVETVRLTIGGQVITMVSGNPPSSPITITRAAHAVAAVYLRADGSNETLVTSAEFELRLVPANSSILTFTTAGAFGGTLTGVAAGSTTMRLELFHKVEGHADFTVTNIAVTVQ